MKTLGIFLLMITAGLAISAQDTYEQAMGQALAEFGSASGPEDMKASAAQFERIAAAKPDEWLPAYYSSMIYCILSFSEQDKKRKEQYIEKAQAALDKALEISPKESEIQTLQGMIYQAILVVDPERNGQEYMAKANGFFETAMKLNPENPRPVYLQAVNVYHMPAQFGGGAEVALPMFEAALEKFQNFQPENSLYPDWGQDDCERLIKECRSALASE